MIRFTKKELLIDLADVINGQAAVGSGHIFSFTAGHGNKFGSEGGGIHQRTKHVNVEGRGAVGGVRTILPGGVRESQEISLFGQGRKVTLKMGKNRGIFGVGIKSQGTRSRVTAKVLKEVNQSLKMVATR